MKKPTIILAAFLFSSCSHIQKERTPASEAIEKPFQLSCRMFYTKYKAPFDNFTLEENAEGEVFHLSSKTTKHEFKGFTVTIRENQNECFENDSRCFLNIRYEKGDTNSWSVIPLKHGLSPKFPRFNLKIGLELSTLLCGYQKDFSP
jgi:hypothetical protein